MKILNELKTAKGFDTFISSTFDVDLPWFEALILSQFRRNGIKRLILMVDHSQLSMDLPQQINNLYSLGKEYVILPVNAPISFHPKFFLLTGSNQARIYVGSGNITRGGLDRNIEVFERWDLSMDDEFCPNAFVQIQEYILRLLNMGSFHTVPIAQNIINNAFSVPVFSKPEEDDPELKVWSFPKAETFLNQLKTQIPLNGDLKIVAPFFDDKGKLISELVEMSKCKSFEILTDMRNTNLTYEAAQYINGHGGTLKKIDENKHSRPLHAKLYYVKGQNREVGIVGSANASIAAWQGHNYELIVVRSGRRAKKVHELINQFEITDLVESDWVKLHKNSEEAKDKKAMLSSNNKPIPPIVSYAEWRGISKIQINARKGDWEPTDVEFASEKPFPGKNTTCKYIEKDDLVVNTVCMSNHQRNSITLIRLKNRNESSEWAVVHDPEEILAAERGGIAQQEKLKEILGSESFDPDGAQKLLHLYAKILKDRAAKKNRKDSKETKSKEQNSDDANSQKHDWVVVDHSELTKNIIEPVSNDKETIFSNVLLTSRLMNRLLYGDTKTDDIIDNEGESELEEEDLDKEEKDPYGDSVNPNKTKQKNNNKPRETQSFIIAAHEARKAYIENVSDFSNRDPYRFIDDLQILAATLHYMIRGGGITQSTYTIEMVSLLRTVLEGPYAPLIASLAELPDTSLKEFWDHTSGFILMNLLVYNACLADLEISPVDEISHDISDALPVLWLRNFIRLVPNDYLTNIEEKVLRNIPRLKLGIFWLSDIFSTWSAQIPFDKFVGQMVKGSKALNEIEAIFDKFENLVPRKDLLNKAEDENEPVIVRNLPGNLGIGWVESEPTEQVLIFDGAFQSATPSSYRSNIKSYSIEKGLPLFYIEEKAAKLGLKITESFTFIRSIAP